MCYSVRRVACRRCNEVMAPFLLAFSLTAENQTVVARHDIPSLGLSLPSFIRPRIHASIMRLRSFYLTLCHCTFFFVSLAVCFRSSLATTHGPFQCAVFWLVVFLPFFCLSSLLPNRAVACLPPPTSVPFNIRSGVLFIYLPSAFSKIKYSSPSLLSSSEVSRK